MKYYFDCEVTPMDRKVVRDALERCNYTPDTKGVVGTVGYISEGDTRIMFTTPDTVKTISAAWAGLSTADAVTGDDNKLFSPDGEEIIFGIMDIHEVSEVDHETVVFRKRSDGLFDAYVVEEPLHEWWRDSEEINTITIVLIERGMELVQMLNKLHCTDPDGFREDIW